MNIKEIKRDEYYAQFEKVENEWWEKADKAEVEFLKKQKEAEAKWELEHVDDNWTDSPNGW